MPDEHSRHILDVLRRRSGELLPVAGTDAVSVAAASLRLLTSLLRCEAGAMFDADNAVLRLLAYHGLDPETDTASERFGTWMFRDLWHAKVVSREELPPAAARVTERWKIGDRLLLCPLLGDDAHPRRRTGFLLAGRLGPRAGDETDLAVVEVIAAITASALQTCRARADIVRNARDVAHSEQRRRSRLSGTVEIVQDFGDSARSISSAVADLCDLAAARADHPDLGPTLDRLRRETGRMASAIDDIVRLTSVVLEPHAHGDASIPAGIAREVASAVESRKLRQGARVELDVDPDLHNAIPADHRLLRRLLSDLVDHAIAASDEATVRLQARMVVQDDEPMVEYTLRQYGGGGEAAQAFEAAEGAAKTLRTCRRLVDLLGGEFSSASREGDGGVFRIVLPSRDVEARDVEAPVPVELSAVCV